jgi:hypothetical protein
MARLTVVADEVRRLAEQAGDAAAHPADGAERGPGPKRGTACSGSGPGLAVQGGPVAAAGLDQVVDRMTNHELDRGVSMSLGRAA